MQDFSHTETFLEYLWGTADRAKGRWDALSRDMTEDAPLKLAYALFTMLSLAAVPGCGGAISSLTDKHCDCVGCSDTKRNDYSYQLEDAQKSADDKGCSDQFDDFVNCANDHYQCDGGRDDITGCSTEGDKLARCIGHNVF